MTPDAAFDAVSGDHYVTVTTPFVLRPVEGGPGRHFGVNLRNREVQTLAGQANVGNRRKTRENLQPRASLMAFALKTSAQSLHCKL
jgi:hypothetical protein